MYSSCSINSFSVGSNLRLRSAYVTMPASLCSLSTTRISFRWWRSISRRISHSGVLGSTVTALGFINSRTFILVHKGVHDAIFGENGVTGCWLTETSIRPWERGQHSAARRERGAGRVDRGDRWKVGYTSRGRRSGGGFGWRGFDLRFSGLACEHPQPSAKRGEDNDGDNAPPSADMAAADLQIYAGDNADQLAKAHEAEDHTGDSQPESWRVHDNILSGVCPLGAGLTECVARVSFTSATKPASLQLDSRLRYESSASFR